MCATRLRFTTILAVLTLAALSACGGGGGGSGTASAGAPPVTSTPQPAPITQVATQRTAAQQALGLINGSQEFSGGGLAVASVMRRAAGTWRRPAQTLRRTASIGVCIGGEESSFVQTSPTTGTFMIEMFYDVSCQTPASTFVWNATQTSAVSFNGPGNVTYQDRSGNVIGYANFQLSGAFTDITYTQLAQVSLDITSLAQSVGGPSLGSFAIACGLGSQANSLNCGLGAVANVASLSTSYGATLALSGTGTVSGSGTNVRVNGSAQAFEGTLGGLSLSAGTFPTWVITGGAQVDQATGSLTALYAPNGLPTSLTETITDSADQATISVSANPSGLSGTVTNTQNGAVVATFTVDSFGFGTITYSNGATASIVRFVIVG